MKPHATESEMRLIDDQPVNTTLRNIILIVIAAFAVGGAAVRWELKLTAVQALGDKHTLKLEEISVVQADSHDRLLKMEFGQKEQAKLLNYIAGGRKGDPPPKAGDGN